MIRIFTLTACTTASLLSAQSATATNFGRGCELPGNPPPLIRALSNPVIGTSMTVRFTGPNSITPVSEDQPVLLTGIQQTSITIPPISALQPGNCNLLTLPLIYQVMPRSGRAFQNAVTFKIPNDRTLIGVKIFQQYASIYRRCTPCVDQMIRVSDGLELVIGL